MKTLVLLSTILAFLFSSCTKDFCNREVTYIKALPILGDLADFRHPIENTVPRLLENPHKILITSDLLVISEKDLGIHFIDNSNPEHPEPMNFVPIKGISDMSVENSNLLVRTQYDLLELDITAANNVQLLNRHEAVFPTETGSDQAVIGYEVQEVTESLDCDGVFFDNGNWVIFSTNGTQIPLQDVPVSFVGSMSSSQSELQFGTLNRLAIVDDFVYYIDYGSIYVFQKTGSDITLLNEISSPYILETIYPHNDQLYIGARTGMVVYDLSDPTNPSFEQLFEHVNTCDPVLPHGDVAYVTLRSGNDCNGDVNELLVADLSENFSQWPRFIHSTSMDNPHGMAIQNEFLYVSEGEFGMKIFDISRSESPNLHRTESGFTSYDVINHPTNPDIIISAGPNGITQFEVVDGKDISTLSRIEY